MTQKKRDALSNRLKKYRQKALGMEEVIYLTEKHLETPQKIVDKINTTQLEIQKLTNSGRGKKTKNRRIKKNQTKTRRRKQTRRKKQKKPKKKKN